MARDRNGNQKPVQTAPALPSSLGPRGKDIEAPQMGSYDGIFVQSYKYAPYNPDKLTSQKGFDLADDMLTYAACRANFNLKRYAVLSEGWSVEPAVRDPLDTRMAEAQLYADFVRWCFNNIMSEAGLYQDFRSVLFEISRAAWDGFKVSEIGYKYLEEGPYAGRIGFQGFYHKPAKQIDFALDARTMQVQAITSYTPSEGFDFDIDVSRCVLYTHNPQAGLPHGMGDWRACYKNWFAGDNLSKFLAIALERWGGPVLIAKYPAGNKQALADAQAALSAIRQGAPAVLPDNVNYDVVSVMSMVFDGFLNAIKFHNEQIALNINSNTLSTGAGQNSLALGEVHQDTGNTVYDFLKSDLESVITSQIIRRLCEINFAAFDMSLLPHLSLGGKDSSDLLNKAKAYDLLIKDGVVWKRAKWLREDMGVPPLDEEEEAGLDAEQQAQEEAQKQLADARNSGKVAPMNDAEVQNALQRLQIALMASSVPTEDVEKN